MQRSMLIAGHGGTAALRGGAPAVFGHGKARRGAHELRDDDATLSRLSRVWVEAPGRVSTCAAVRRSERDDVVLRVPHR